MSKNFIATFPIYKCTIFATTIPVFALHYSSTNTGMRMEHSSLT
ncbi:hypothetical protein MARINOS108_10706 [Marinoscillum sp. 108]|nr:hypothetical protein MARINOS108_10706 [Marinoscillum sp. 108]